jgi:two-component system sensor histidine kinase KdpD
VQNSKQTIFVRLSNYLYATMSILACTAIAKLLQERLDSSSLTMVYLLGVVWSAVRYGRGPSILASVLSILAFDYFYVPPYYSFLVHDRQSILTFVVMLVIALILSTLTTRVSQLTIKAEYERLRNALLSSVSHDLRTPLATITGAASELIGTPQIAEQKNARELAQVIYEEARAMERFISNLLNMTTLEAGALTVSKEWQPVEEVVGSALTRLEERLSGRSISIDLPGHLPHVPLDAILIEHVLVNILDNAIKYTPPDAQLKISASADARNALISVADTGSGITAEDRERIFDKFYRGQPSVPTAGTGLGLAICRGIVEAHGGRIWCETNVPHGTVFNFTLPIEGAPPMLTERKE